MRIYYEPYNFDQDLGMNVKEIITELYIYLNNIINLENLNSYTSTYVQRLSHKLDPSHNGDGEWIKGNKKFLYYFEVLAIVFELEKEMSKPICD